MRIDVLTLFPEVMQPYLAASILGRAQAAGLVEFHTHQLRDFSRDDKHQTVDDRPFGGGAGMVLLAQPICDAVAAIEAADPRPALRILLTPQGRPFSQALAGELAGHERLLLICGHYEGYDERIVSLLNPLEISLGDFVLTGGEIAGLAVIDAVTRLVPGVLGNDAATADESFQHSRLEYPQYTRPRSFRGLDVPEVLLSGNHAQIEAWRRNQAEQRTAARRPDLLGPPSADPPASCGHAPGGIAPGLCVAGAARRAG
jgi:tRNA (guanine37-N1)-methyltransferase